MLLVASILQPAASSLLLGQLTNVSPDHLQQITFYLVGVMGAVVMALKVVDHFRPRKIEASPTPFPVTGVPGAANKDELDQLRDDLKSLRDAQARQAEQAELRASRLHKRIDPLIENTAQIKGQMEGFGDAVRAFSALAQNCADKGRR